MKQLTINLHGYEYCAPNEHTVLKPLYFVFLGFLMLYFYIQTE